jgi:type III pantothenate kinase
MNLIVDVGNTRIKAFLLDNEVLIKEKVFMSDPVVNLQQFVLTDRVDKALISASGTIDNDFIDYRTKIPIINHYRTPETLGMDRLAAVVGAFELYPGEASLVIDAGTCVTYDAIDQNGNYYGGNISPGIKMRCKAMHHFTARLPEIEPADFSFEVGFDTESSLLTGVVLGVSYEIDGFIRQYKRKYKVLNVILTGGDAKIVAKHLKTAFVINNRISLLGLNKILSYNV